MSLDICRDSPIGRDTCLIKQRKRYYIFLKIFYIKYKIELINFNVPKNCTCTISFLLIIRIK